MGLIETAKNVLRNVETNDKNAFVLAMHEVRRIIRILNEAYPGKRIFENPLYARRKEAWDAHLSIMLFLQNNSREQIARLKKMQNQNIRKEDTSYLRKQIVILEEHVEKILDTIEELQEGFEKNKEPWTVLEEHKNTLFEWVSM